MTSDRYRAFATGTGVQVTNSIDDTRWGAVVGVGLEYGFAPNWSFGVEYDHMFMQDKTYTFTNNGTLPARLARCSPPNASVRTSIWLPPASTTAGVARSSRSTDLPDPISI